MHYFALLTLLALLSCKDSGKSQINIKEKISGLGSDSKTSGSKNVYTVPTYQSSIQQQDSSIATQAQSAQEFMTTVARIVNPAEKSFTRTDHIYKCKTYLSHAYFLIDPNNNETNTGSFFTNKIKESVRIISQDMRLDRVGNYDAVSAAVDATGTLYVFFANNSLHEVMYTWMNTTANTWQSPTLLAGQHMKGLATATFDKTSQKIQVSVFNLADQKLYTFIQGNNGSFAAQGSANPSSQSAFDQLQATNGTNLSNNYHVILDSITMQTEAPTSIGTEIINNLFTFGGAFLASQFYHEKQLQMIEDLKSLQTSICPN